MPRCLMIVAAIVIAGCARPAPAAVTATGAPATVTTAVGVTPATAVRILIPQSIIRRSPTT